MSDTADLLRAIAGLSWVVLAFVVVTALFRLLRSQDTPLTKLGVGPTGVTFEFAEAKFTEAVSKSNQESQRAIGEVAKRSVVDRLQSHASLLAGARILWVDDHPENNLALIDLLRQFGASVDTSRSNSDAFALLSASRYDAIISDVARDDEGPNSDLKGIEFAHDVFERWGQRVLLFTARFDPARLPGKSEEQRLGIVAEVQRSVFARTNRYDEALHYILDVLER